MNNPSSGVPVYAVLAAVVALILIAAGFVAALAITGHVDTTSTPLITTVLGFVSITVLGLLGFLGLHQGQQSVANSVDGRMNELLSLTKSAAFARGQAVPAGTADPNAIAPASPTQPPAGPPPA